MAYVVFGAPYTPPAPESDPWPGVTMRWEPAVGPAWNLSGPRTEGVRMQAGVRGLTMPPWMHDDEASANLHGITWRGVRAAEREVYWPLWVWKDTNSAEWLAYDAAFAMTFDVRRPGRWVVTDPAGRSRFLTLRLASDGGPGWAASPGRRQWAAYEITLRAENPFWQGAEQVRWFSAPAPAPFFATDPASFVTISEDSTLASASIPNPGDEAAWPVAWVVGPTTSVELGFGGEVIDVPFSVADGRMLVVNSHPTERVADEIDAPDWSLSDAEQEAWVADRLATAATDRTIELGESTGWAPIPAGESIPLALTMVGTGSVRVALTPQHWRAW